MKVSIVFGQPNGKVEIMTPGTSFETKQATEAQISANTEQTFQVLLHDIFKDRKLAITVNGLSFAIHTPEGEIRIEEEEECNPGFLVVRRIECRTLKRVRRRRSVEVKWFYLTLGLHWKEMSKIPEKLPFDALRIPLKRDKEIKRERD